MADLIIRNATIVDGTGAPATTGDLAVEGERIVAVGDCSDVATSGARIVDADGMVLTPGFVDLHTHYDGQITWDPVVAPSSVHGVTTVAVGNCGVGFAPAAPDRHDWLIGLLEGVEDIPGTALAEGLTWDWESFPEYLDAIAAMPRTLDVASHVPHAALRTYVMGEQEVRAWTVPVGAKAPQAAGVIHTDFERGFIRAEVIAYDDFVKFKGEHGAKEAGKMRLEGKEYIVRDGDVMHFRFNV